MMAQTNNHANVLMYKNATYWLVVLNMCYFSIYWEFHHPNWRSHIFQRGRYTTKQSFSMLFGIMTPIHQIISRGLAHPKKTHALVPWQFLAWRWPWANHPRDVSTRVSQLGSICVWIGSKYRGIPWNSTTDEEKWVARTWWFRYPIYRPG